MMIYTRSASEAFANELFETARVFYPGSQRAHEREGLIIVHSAVGKTVDGIDRWTDSISVTLPSGKVRRFSTTTRDDADALSLIRRRKYGMRMKLYRLLKAETGQHPPWGALTGVRPTRLFAQRVASGLTPPQSAASLAREYDITPEKVNLLADVYWMQRALLDAAPNALDIYVGIPFCPTTCDYCSFGSIPIQSFSPLQVTAYVEALKHELIAIRPMMGDMGFLPRCVYVGGGTPTVLPGHLLEQLLRVLRGLFPEAIEWTVEAGRPDTLDNDRLEVLRDAGIRRISINPQTMNDATLARIGRNHTAADVLDAYQRARPHFPIINMDIIAALPGETPEDMQQTLDILQSLKPDNLTVHTLAIKRASRLHHEGAVNEDAAQAEAAVAAAAACAAEMGLLPYYLYRQKAMAGELENVGYARPGTACRYNVDIMEEGVAIAAFGAGGISKAIHLGGRIERSPNVRNAAEYILRIEEMIARKRMLWKT